MAARATGMKNNQTAAVAGAMTVNRPSYSFHFLSSTFSLLSFFFSSNRMAWGSVKVKEVATACWSLILFIFFNWCGVITDRSIGRCYCVMVTDQGAKLAWVFFWQRNYFSNGVDDQFLVVNCISYHLPWWLL